MLDREKTVIVDGKIKCWKAASSLQHFLKIKFSIQKNFLILVFFPTEDGNLTPRLTIGTLHPWSDFIHCSKVSGAERQHARNAKTSKPSYNEKHDGILNKSSEYTYTQNYLHTASLRTMGSFLPRNTLKCLLWPSFWLMNKTNNIRPLQRRGGAGRPAVMPRSDPTSAAPWHRQRSDGNGTGLLVGEVTVMGSGGLRTLFGELL